MDENVKNWIAIIVLISGIVAKYFWDRDTDRKDMDARLKDLRTDLEKKCDGLEANFIPRAEMNIVIAGYEKQLGSFERRMEDHHTENRMTNRDTNEKIDKTNEKIDKILDILRKN